MVRLFRGAANVSTLVHELGHVFRRTLGETDLDAVARHYGEIGTKSSEEGFALGFERYLREGRAPTPRLEGVFRRFEAWMTAIYAKVKGSSIETEVHPEIRDVFDRMLGGGGESVRWTDPATPSTRPKGIPYVASSAARPGGRREEKRRRVRAATERRTGRNV